MDLCSLYLADGVPNFTVNFSVKKKANDCKTFSEDILRKEKLSPQVNDMCILCKILYEGCSFFMKRINFQGSCNPFLNIILFQVNVCLFGYVEFDILALKLQTVFTNRY